MIGLPPYLASLQAWKKQVDNTQKALDPAQVIAEFVNGKAAIAMVPVNRQWLAANQEAKLPPLTIGGIPGSQSIFDGSRDTWTEQLPGTMIEVPLTATTGMLTSCAASTDQQRNAIEVMIWMTSKPISSVVSVESTRTGLSRKSHLGNPGKWLGEQLDSEQLSQFTDYMIKLNSGRRQMTALRIPQADRYMDALDQAVRGVILEDQNAVEALAAVAARWEVLSNEIGRDAQLKAYRKSEGLRE